MQQMKLEEQQLLFLSPAGWGFFSTLRKKRVKLYMFLYTGGNTAFRI